MVTRRKAKVAAANRTTMRIRSSVIEGAKDLQRLPSGFEAALIVARKKKAGAASMTS
jgi:hypothetical protein